MTQTAKMLNRIEQCVINAKTELAKRRLIKLIITVLGDK